jgi:hypothetical protein
VYLWHVAIQRTIGKPTALSHVTIWLVEGSSHGRV